MAAKPGTLMPFGFLDLRPTLLSSIKKNICPPAQNMSDALEVEEESRQLGPGASGCVGSRYLVENGLAVLGIKGKHCLQEFDALHLHHR